MWDELIINHNLTIPDIKPPMEKLLGYLIRYDITKAAVIDTRLMTDDQSPVPIRKVIVEGLARITVKYVADVEDQQVHGAHFEETFSRLIEWPGGPSPGTPICVEITEEHVQIHMIDDRHLSKVIVIQLDITINDSSTGGG